MTNVFIALGLGVVLGIGGILLGRMLDRQGATGLGRGAQIAGILILLAGVGRAAWSMRGTEGPGFEMPSFGLGLDEAATPEAIGAQCRATNGGGFEDPTTVSTFCECAVGAVQQARLTDPDFAVRSRQGGLVAEGTGLHAFAGAFGACAGPQLGGWVRGECVPGCVAESGQRSECEQACSCVARELARGRNPDEIGRMFWIADTGPNESPDRTFDNAMIRAQHQCQLRGWR